MGGTGCWARRLARAAVACLAALALSGCWDRREIETLAVATALALDRLEEGRGVLVTGQFSIPARATGAAGGGGMAAGTGPGSGLQAPFGRTSGGPQGPTVWVVGAPGATVRDAENRILHLAPRQPFWAHLRLVAVGEPLAREGLSDVLDSLLRGRQFRRTSWLVVTREMPAYRLLELPSPMAPGPEEGVTRLLDILRARSASVLTNRLHDFLSALAEPGVDPVAAGVSYEIPVSHDPTLTPSDEELPALPRPSGTAVFQDDRLVGWLSAEESRALALLMGATRAFHLVHPCPQSRGLAGVIVLRFQAHRELRWVGSGDPGLPPTLPRFGVRIVADAELTEQTCQPPVNRQRLLQLEDDLGRRLGADMRRLVSRLHRELGVDPAGFGREVYHSHPDWWARYGQRWRQLLARVEVDPQVQLAVRRTGIETGRLVPDS